MVMYVIGYGMGRFWVEGLRIDRADELGGLRWNQWVALAAVVGGVIVLAFMRRYPIAEPVLDVEPVELDLSDVPPDEHLGVEGDDDDADADEDDAGTEPDSDRSFTDSD